jgi:hypothetical protein
MSPNQSVAKHRQGPDRDDRCAAVTCGALSLSGPPRFPNGDCGGGVNERERENRTARAEGGPLRVRPATSEVAGLAASGSTDGRRRHPPPVAGCKRRKDYGRHTTARHGNNGG